jgi:hypothetical protein
MYTPKTRSTRLLVEELVEELLIYDVDRNEVHCLNGPAVQVWKLCNGERTISEIATALNTDLDHEAAETLVWSAIEQFAEKHLLDVAEDVPLAAHRPQDLTRRQMLLRLGVVVAALPLVDSIVSPEAALAQSLGSTANTPTTPA